MHPTSQPQNLVNIDEIPDLDLQARLLPCLAAGSLRQAFVTLTGPAGETPGRNPPTRIPDQEDLLFTAFLSSYDATHTVDASQVLSMRATHWSRGHFSMFFLAPALLFRKPASA